MHILFFLHLSPAKVENTISHSCLLQTWSPKVWRSTWFLFCQLTFSSCAYAMLTTWTTKTNCGLLWMWLLVLSKRSPWWVWSVLFSIPIYSVKYTFIDSLCNFSFPLQLLENILSRCSTYYGEANEQKYKLNVPISDSPEWLGLIVLLAVQHVPVAQLSQAVQRRSGKGALFVKRITDNCRSASPHTSYLLFCCSQKEFSKHSTARQVNNCLQNFDLSDHQQVVSDLAICIYHQFIAAMERALTPAIGMWQSKKKKPTTNIVY